MGQVKIVTIPQICPAYIRIACARIMEVNNSLMDLFSYGRFLCPLPKHPKMNVWLFLASFSQREDQRSKWTQVDFVQVFGVGAACSQLDELPSPFLSGVFWGWPGWGSGCAWSM